WRGCATGDETNVVGIQDEEAPHISARGSLTCEGGQHVSGRSLNSPARLLDCLGVRSSRRESVSDGDSSRLRQRRRKRDSCHLSQHLQLRESLRSNPPDRIRLRLCWRAACLRKTVLKASKHESRCDDAIFKNGEAERGPCQFWERPYWLWRTFGQSSCPTPGSRFG